MVALHIAKSEAVQAKREYKSRWQSLWRCIPENREREKIQSALQ